MKVMIARIPFGGSDLVGEDPGSILELEDDLFTNVNSPVRYDLFAQHVSNELVVRGTLSVDLEVKCARCSSFFSTTVSDSDFLRAYSASKDAESVDITADMREDLLLHIPSFLVCEESCKGLCAQCGADLNNGSCSCESDERPNPWSSLDNLEL